MSIEDENVKTNSENQSVPLPPKIGMPQSDAGNLRKWIKSGEDCASKAMGMYHEYLNTIVESNDKEDQLSRDAERKTREEIKNLRKNIGELREAADKLYGECENSFQNAFLNFESADSSEAGAEGLYRKWGDAVYALAIINKRKFLYRDTVKRFETAIKIYGRISEGVDDVVRRRLGNAYYELAAIKMDNSSYDEAGGFFYKAIAEYVRITSPEDEDHRNCGSAWFELGRIAWGKYMEQRRIADNLYKRSIWDEAVGLPRYRGLDSVADENDCEDPLLDDAVENGDDDIVESRIGDDEETAVKVEVSFVALEKVLGKLFKRVKVSFDCALASYGRISGEEPLGVEKYVEVLRNWGEIYSVFGRKNRLDYLFAGERLKILKNVHGRNSENKAGYYEEVKRNAIEKAKNNFKKAIDKYELAAKLDEKDHRKDWYILGATHYRLYLTYRFGGEEGSEAAQKERRNAGEFFERTKAPILSILVSLSLDVSYPLVNDVLLFSLLDNKKNDDAVFFNNVVERAKRVGEDIDAEDVGEYKEVYIRAMFVISRLEVRSEHEKVVAYYTRRGLAQKMLFAGKKFRMNATTSFNDPTEGGILLDYLFKRQKQSKEERLKDEPSGIVTFVGCFSFNYDSLVQFRLYGKENGVEGSGLSLVFNKSFFSGKLKQDRAAFLRDFVDNKELVLLKKSEWADFGKKIRKSDEHRYRFRRNTLFRCVYFDSEKDRVETVGQKVRYLFYRENNNKRTAEREYEKYSKFINGIVEDVDCGLNNLKSAVNRTVRGGLKNLSVYVLGQLTFKLRYLIKHVAFKEEQECRIAETHYLGEDKADISFGSEDKSDPNGMKMHIEYDTAVSGHLKEIYFGPNAIEFITFKDHLVYDDLEDIECRKSTNPLAGDKRSGLDIKK